MFQGLAAKIKGGPLPKATVSPVKTALPKNTKAPVSKFGGLAAKIREKNAPVAPPPAPPVVYPKIDMRNPLGIKPAVPPAPVAGPVAPAPQPTIAPPAAVAPTIARGPRIADLTRTPVLPPKPTGTITAPPPEKKGFFTTAKNTLKEAFNDTVKRGVELSEALLPTGKYDEKRGVYYAPEVTPSDRGAAMLRAAIGPVNLAFAPLTAAFKGAEDINLESTTDKFNPALVTAKYGAKALNKATEFVAEKGAQAVGKGFEYLPQTEGVQKFKPVAEEIGSLATVLLVGKIAHETAKAPKTIEEYKTRTATTNDIVSSAKKILDIPEEKNGLGQAKKVAPETIQQKYREVAYETHPDRGGTAQEFQTVTKAKQILEDHANLSPKEFAEKYKAPLAEVQKTLQQLPAGDASKEAVAPKPAFEGLANKLKTEPKAPNATEIVPKVAEAAPEPRSVVPRPVEAISGVPAERPAVIPSTTPAEPTYALPKVKGVPIEKVKFNAENPVHDRVLTEILGAERGRRIAVQNDNTAGMAFSRQASTFPKWIPKELRRKPLLNAVADHVYNGTLPTKAPEARLYKIVADEMKAQNEVLQDAEFIQTQRNNLIDPFATAEENAAKLAKFDDAYAKLKAGEEIGSAPPSGGAVQGVDQPVVLRDNVFPSPETASSPEVARKMGVPTKSSKVGRSIEAKAIEKQLAESFSDTAQYTPTTIKEQAARVADLMNTDIERAKRIVSGEEKLPDGVLAGSIIKAMEDYALKEGDVQLALDIANSPLTAETSIHAQEMRMLAERDPDSAVAAIQKLKKIKEEAAKKADGAKQRVAKEIKEVVEKAKKSKATKQTWSEFIDSITC